MGDEILWSLHTSKAEQLEYKLTVAGTTGASEHSPRAVPKPGWGRSWSGSKGSSKNYSVSYSLMSPDSFYFWLKSYDEYKEALVLLCIESKGQTGFMFCPPYCCLFQAFPKGGLAFITISSLWNSALQDSELLKYFLPTTYMTILSFLS